MSHVLDFPDRNQQSVPVGRVDCRWPAVTRIVMLSDRAVVYRTLTYCIVKSSRPKSGCLCYCRLCRWCCCRPISFA